MLSPCRIRLPFAAFQSILKGEAVRRREAQIIAEIEQCNAEILARLSAFLNERPDAIAADMVDEMRATCGGNVEEAYALLLASLCGLDVAENAAHRALYRAYFPRMVRRLDAAAYRRDPYLANVKIPPLREGRWTTCVEAYKPYEAFVCDDLQALPDGRVIPRIGFFEEAFPFPAVFEDGREWMLITPNEIETMRPAIRAARGRVLTYGLGLGYFAYMAARKECVSSVTIVEREEAAIQLFKRHILGQFPAPEKIELVRCDAFDFAARRMAAGHYDVVFTDLWHDPSDGLALYRRMKAFEAKSPQSQYLYWIERTLKCYL